MNRQFPFFKNKSFFQIALLLAAFFICIPALQAAPQVEHVFIISIDGGKPAVIQQSDMPVLKKWAAQGAWTWNATTIIPSKTLPAHTSMLTGVTPEKHKVLWNDYEPAKGMVQMPTVFSEAKQAGFTTAMFVGKEKFRHLLISNSMDEFDYNTVSATMITKKMEGSTNEMNEGTVKAKAVATKAAAYIIAKKPNVCFIHLTDTDDTGHKYGWGSPEQIKAFGDVDDAMGKIAKAIRKAGIENNSVIIVSADHGGHAKTHGLTTLDDMIIPWVVWGKGVKKDYQITAPVNTCDTTATALWLLGIPLPANLDGKPVTSAFE